MLQIPSSRFRNWSDYNSFNSNDLTAFVNAYVSAENVTSTSQIDPIRRAIFDFYSLPASNHSSQAPVYAGFQRFVHLLADIQVTIPLLWEARLKAQRGWPAYIFHFAYTGTQKNSPYPYRAAAHGDESALTLAGDADDEVEGSAVTRTVRAVMLDAYVRFVKTGDPGPKWPRLNSFGGTGCAGAMEGYRAAKITSNGVCTEGRGESRCDRKEDWQLSVASRLDPTPPA